MRNNTKRGGASLYVVIFMTLVLGVISLSYVRIMLSNASQTTNTDLSQSAYDSALAGIEDAKIALLKYHDCISRGYTAANSDTNAQICEQVIRAMQDGIASQSCDVVKDVLNRIVQGDQGETMIEETNTVIDSDSNNSLKMDQAYTCVRISEELKDYRSTLSSSNRIRIVPLRSAEYASVNKIRLSWYSDVNAAQRDGTINYALAPIISLDIFQTDKTFTAGELSTSNDGANGATSYIGTDHAKLFLKPGTRSATISASEYVQASDKHENSILEGNCARPGTNGHDDFYCYADIELPNPYRGGERSESSFFLRLTLPEGTPTTDFAVNLCKGGVECSTREGINGVYEFTGVQTMIDSTGRANDLYRRVETRVELVDNYFPYPEFALQVEGPADDGVSKNFWSTRDCWGANNGEMFSCENQNDL